MRWSPLLLLLVLAAGCADSRTVAIDEVPVARESVRTTGDASTGSFTVDCGTNAARHLNADNMVITPGQPFGAHHTHEYVGNTTTDAGSTDESLAAASAGTTCRSGDPSTYYWPVLRLTDRTGHDHRARGGGAHGNTGEVLPPSSVEITFTGSPVSEVVPMPRFLRMITGDPAALGTGRSRARWSCWDGRNTDSPSHRAHVEFPGTNGVCRPGTFPMPKLRVRVAYDVPAGRPFAVDSFPEQLRDPRTDHAMFVNVMPDALMSRVTACVNAGRTCS